MTLAETIPAERLEGQRKNKNHPKRLSGAVTQFERHVTIRRTRACWTIAGAGNPCGSPSKLESRR